MNADGQRRFSLRVPNKTSQRIRIIAHPKLVPACWLVSMKRGGCIF
jgi:hypothetical protein